MQLKDEREDLLYLIKMLLAEGAMPSEVGKQNFYDFLEVLKARPKDRRPELIDPIDAVIHL
ncbi:MULTISPECIES: hypothetical protein [unclassified Lactobacillus]|uniref:hypothetical protein n=1 Tax=unclassified Lactobacillus TaxID=2620435 RepID=UPI00226A0BEF|nr:MULTISPECIES: hypothetical protein [unclassified Lactobacillus]MCX8721221.1 hypothetical protein [Lactobacillus sp. B4010]MCX8731953.1 hypothetical protein [Lactobacillus sp. B4015]MCX8734360.1 hypothetical protein [Lactobacillus sp. B4012]